MKNKILGLVDKICDMKSTDCHSLNKSELARELMNIAGISEVAEISEIPLDCDRQVVILFLVPDDDNYYSLFAGIGTDGNFYFQLAVTGGFLPDNKFEFLDDEEVLPIDYFKNSKNDNSKMKAKERKRMDIYGKGQEIGALIVCYCKRKNIDIDCFYEAIREETEMFIAGIGDGIGGNRENGKSVHNGILEGYKV